jgi:hypothetical protein
MLKKVANSSVISIAIILFLYFLDVIISYKEDGDLIFFGVALIYAFYIFLTLALIQIFRFFLFKKMNYSIIILGMMFSFFSALTEIFISIGEKYPVVNSGFYVTTITTATLFVVAYFIIFRKQRKV